MPWYKFYASHGPGHQSYDEEYQYFSRPLRGDERRERWVEWCHSHWDYPFGLGGAKLVHRLPREAVDLMNIRYSEQIVNAQFMLKLLEGVETFEPREKPSWECLGCRKRWRCRVPKKHLVRNCNKRVPGKPERRER